MTLPPVGELGFVNHVPTLLRNNRTIRNAGDTACGDDVFVDPRHKTLDSGSSLKQVLDVLFGTQPERCYFNHRMHLLLQAMHGTEFEDIILDNWPRITYDLDSTSLLDAPFGESTVRAQPDPGSSITQASVVGIPVPDHQKGTLLQTWSIRVDLPVPRVVTITNLLDGTTTVDSTGANSFELPTSAPAGDPLLVRFTTSGSEIPTGTYTVSALARPTEGLPGIKRRIDALGTDTLNDLFDNGEKVSLGERLFRGHFSLGYQMAGLTISLSFQMDKLRQAGTFLIEPAV